MTEPLFSVTVTVPGEPPRERVVGHDGLVATLREATRGGLPADADVRVSALDAEPAPVLAPAL
jgi:hypothetical protein